MAMTAGTSRRGLLKVASAALIAAGLAATPVMAEEAKPGEPFKLTGELAKAGPLGDQWLGDANAPVTVIEYASMTCSHCAHFHEATWPAFKKKYIDTGKVRFALREFPFDPLATAAFMLARCSTTYYPLIDLLFDTQAKWAFDTQNPADELLKTVKQAGFTQDSFNACLKDQRIYDAVNDVKKRGEQLGVDATPTFFINGKKVSGALSEAEMDKEIQPLLPK